VNPLTDLTRAWQGLTMIVAGDRDAAGQFNPTRTGLFIALGWFALSLVLSAAAQSASSGLPSFTSLAIGFFIQAMTIVGLGVVTAQSFHFLKLDVPTTVIFVPIVYLMALVQLLAIPLNFLGSSAQLIAVLALVVMIWRAGMVLAGMRMGVAIAFALVCLLTLVVVPNALYIVFLQIPSPA
jgi:hypothetical protein